MRIGAFEVNEPLPELKSPHVIAMLKPWIDAGNVGTNVLTGLEKMYDAVELARIGRPGNFFDFTRYRPMMYIDDGERKVALPNTTLTYHRREGDNDFVFLHMLEPHMLGEVFVESVLDLLLKLGIKRYVLLGSMYDFVPHTRALRVSGGTSGEGVKRAMQRAGVRSSDYQGPTTITSLISQRAAREGLETATLIVHIPQYTQLEDDYMGELRVMEVLGSLYNFTASPETILRAHNQRKELDETSLNDPEIKEVVHQLEAIYDARIEENESQQLSPEIERFLKEMEGNIRDD